MDLNEMLVFVRVVQGGSFTAAAKALQMPKSTVSRKVSDLEARVGARLIQRTTRKLGLTDAGRAFYERSARIVTEVEEAEASVHRLQSEPRGTLRVTAPLSFTALGPMVSDYLKAFADVRVELTCTDRQVDLVEEGYDVAVRAGPLADSTHVARPLFSMRRLLVASPSYCKARGTPKRPEDLKVHACLSFSAGTTPNVWTLHSEGKKLEVKVTPRLSVNDFEILRQVAIAGLGIAWMPDYMCAEDVRSGRLQVVLPKWCSNESPVQALYPTARLLAAKTAAFIDVMKTGFPKVTIRSRKEGH